MLIDSQINAYILTGGSSRRFGSDKASCMINGSTFLDMVFKILQSNFTHIFSVGKKAYSEKIEFISDFSGYQAAIIGIITVLRHTSSPWNFIISVDTPYITSDVIRALEKEAVDIDANIIIPSVDGQIFPLSGFYHQNCLTYFEKAYSVENYKVMDVITLLKPEIVDLSRYKTELTNVNTMNSIMKRNKIK
jgi:molybdopterin-guanine dinucleotide biosynthesis protein A